MRILRVLLEQVFSLPNRFGVPEFIGRRSKIRRSQACNSASVSDAVKKIHLLKKRTWMQRVRWLLCA